MEVRADYNILFFVNSVCFWSLKGTRYTFRLLSLLIFLESEGLLYIDFSEYIDICWFSLGQQGKEEDRELHQQRLQYLDYGLNCVSVLLFLLDFTFRLLNDTRVFPWWWQIFYKVATLKQF